MTRCNLFFKGFSKLYWNNEHKKKTLKLSDFDPKTKKVIRSNKYKKILSNYMDPTLSFTIEPHCCVKRKTNKFFNETNDPEFSLQFREKKLRS